MSSNLDEKTLMTAKLYADAFSRIAIFYLCGGLYDRAKCKKELLLTSKRLSKTLISLRKG